MSALTEPKVDAHCHVLDPARYPYREGVAYRPAGQEVGTEAQFLAICDAYQVANALLVGPNSGYGEDNACLLGVLARGGGRFRGVAVVPMDADAEALTSLKAQGVVGIAVNATYHGVDYYRDVGALARRLAAAGLFLTIQVEGDQFCALAPLVEDTGVTLVVDHCGRPHPDGGLAQPGFRRLLDWGRAGRASVKLSGLQKISKQSYPYEDARPYLDALIEAFGLERCVWGSDWPFLRAPERLDYGPLLTLVDRLFPRAEDRRALLWETPRRLFGFEP